MKFTTNFCKTGLAKSDFDRKRIVMVEHENSRQKTFLWIIILLLLLALLAGGLAYWFDGAAKEDARRISNLEDKIKELSQRPAPRVIASVEQSCKPVACEPVACRPTKEIIYIEKPVVEETFVDSCKGPRITLKNAQNFSDQTIGNSETCEIKLAAGSYIRVMGNVKFVARKITIRGTINGNALPNEVYNAGSLSLEATDEVGIYGSIEMRGSAKHPVGKLTASAQRGLATVPKDGGRGGDLLLKGKKVHVFGLIDMGGAVPPRDNGRVRISAQQWDNSLIAKKNILNASEFKRVPYVP